MVGNIPAPFVQRDNIYAPRDQWSTDVDRYMNDAPINSPHHYSALAASRSPAVAQAPAIETALREQCHIHIKDFAMIATLEDGSTATFTSEKLVEHEKQLFNREFKETYFRQAGYGYSSQSSHDFDDAIRRHSDSTDSMAVRRNRHRNQQDFKHEDSDDDEATVMPQKRRKRGRGFPGSQVKPDERKASMSQSVRMKNLRIGDTPEVTKFYEGRFRDIQQAACKIIAKVFIKVVEPRKQTNFPYTGGLERAPPWWPTEARMGTPHGVKHKEPDHLLKPERITLLVHILRIAAAKSVPGKEHVTVKELQTKTRDAMLGWYKDKPENMAKGKYLDELFKVAKAEERYRNKEIDGTYTISVMHGADQGPADISDDEAEEGVHDDDDDAVPNATTPASSQICTPESAVISPISSHSVQRPMSGNAIQNFSPFHAQRGISARQFSTASANGLIHPRPDDNPAYENDSLGMGVQTYIPPRMGDMQHQPHQTHGLPDLARRPTWSSPPNGLSYATNWPINNMMGSNPVGFNYHNPATTAPLRSNDPILPLPNSSASLLPPMTGLHAGRQHPNFHDPAAMSFRDSNPLRPNALATPQHHPQHYHTPPAAYGINEYMHEYAQGDTQMKVENIGGAS